MWHHRLLVHARSACHEVDLRRLLYPRLENILIKTERHIPVESAHFITLTTKAWAMYFSDSKSLILPIHSTGTVLPIPIVACDITNWSTVNVFLLFSKYVILFFAWKYDSSYKIRGLFWHFVIYHLLICELHPQRAHTPLCFQWHNWMRACSYTNKLNYYKNIALITPGKGAVCYSQFQSKLDY